MNQHIQIHTRLLMAQAGSYDNVEKSIAEFVDNSLDSAEEMRDINFEYKKKIKIEVSFQGSTKKTSQITIKDNCVGMDKEELYRICTHVGDSKKKNHSFSNGQFGFGIFSFSEFFQSVTIQSKNQNSNLAHEVTLSRKILDSNGAISIKTIPSSNFNNGESGTVIILREYLKRNWKGVNKNKLIQFLNQHFERLLGSTNLEIKVRDKNGEEILKPFDYKSLDGLGLIESSEGSPKMELYNKKTGQTKSLIAGEITNNMKCNIKVVKSRNLTEKPFFIAIKGRRIGDVKHAITGKKLDYSIWSSPYLTGFLELGAFAEPDISRTKLKRGERKEVIVEYLQRKEKDIKELLEDRNKQNEDKSWNDTADKINNILKDMTKEFNVHFSELSGSKGKDLGSGGKEGGARIRTGGRKEIPGKKEITDGEGHGLGKGGTGPLGEDQFSDDISNKPRNTALSIRFTGTETHFKTNNITGKKIEQISMLGEDGVLTFWTTHPWFISRVDKRKGSKIITQRLATFLGARIAVHFLDKYFRKGGGGSLDYSIKQLEDNADFILKFEDNMQKLINKKLDSIGRDES